MKAIYFDRKNLSLRELPEPRPGPGEALVRVRLAGVCNTDIELAKGYMDFEGVLGHEFVGTVTECADAAWVGKRVVGEINLACGTCAYCKSNLQRHCPFRTVLGIFKKDGVFAEYITLPVANLHEVPAGTPDEVAVFTEPVAAGYSILERLHAGVEGTKIALLGDGKLGLLASRVLAAAGAEVTLAGRHTDKLRLAASDKIKTVLVDQLLREAAGDVYANFPVVVEATGRPDGFDVAVKLVRPRGIIVVKTTTAEPVPVDLSKVVVNEVMVLGSRCGPFPPALQALASGAVKVDDLVALRLPLSRGIEAINRAGRPGTLKVLIDMEAA